MIIGCGVVGQANGEGLAVKGHDIIYVDKDPRKIESLRQAGRSAYLDKEILHTGMSVDHDICLVCVSTPFVEDSSTDRIYRSFSFKIGYSYLQSMAQDYYYSKYRLRESIIHIF